ncbi:MAG: carboxymuconolactone decarboxylase family protein [Syntrophaceae bacterium]|nr:carboxymuconolactone decarboxylase family protein [Syntrophaceae bacterium]
MKDLHEIFTVFKNEFPAVHEAQEALGKVIHDEAGPLTDKMRWLIKLGISGATGHQLALETHIAKARESGATDDEIRHALLMIIQTMGFPRFMEAYSTFYRMR